MLEKNENKMDEVVALAGDADPAQRRFVVIRPGRAGNPPRPARPFGWAGGLFVLRVARRGDLEARAFETWRESGFWGLAAEGWGLWIVN